MYKKRGCDMYKALDIAKWFINYNRNLRDFNNEDTDDISNLKLQKLLYYAQGCFIAINDRPLFEDDIVAWTHGPVVEAVYKEFKKYGSKGIDEIYDNVDINEDDESLLVDVYEVFGKYSAWGLRNMTHSETPWQTTERNGVIDLEVIKQYFKENYV